MRGMHASGMFPGGCCSFISLTSQTLTESILKLKGKYRGLFILIEMLVTDLFTLGCSNVVEKVSMIWLLNFLSLRGYRYEAAVVTVSDSCFVTLSSAQNHADLLR
jgi:hypothetical protein